MDLGLDDVLNLYAPKILLINPSESFRVLLPTMDGTFKFHLVERPSDGLQIAHHDDIDIIVLFAAEGNNEALGMGMQFKQSMVTRDIPVLILTSDRTTQSQMSPFIFCGVNYLNAACTVQQFTAKANELSRTYRRAQDYQLITSDQNKSPTQVLHIRLAELNRRYIHADDYSLLMFEVDTSSVKIALKDIDAVNQSVCSETLEATIKYHLKRNRDSVVKMNDNKYAVLLPRTDLIGAIRLASEINDMFYFTTSTPTSRMGFHSNALKVGITSFTSQIKNTDETILDLVEKALKTAQDSNEFFFIN